MTSVRETGVFVTVTVACLLALHFCQGCARSQNAAINVWYAAELDRCIERGKQARSVEVYEACARSVDMRTCNQYGARCEAFMDGGASAH